MLLAYREPAVLEASGGLKGPSPSFGREDRAEVFRLMKVWDAKALLLLRPGVLPDIRCSRVFGSFKSPGKFRQIGDRRGPNSLESRLDGVSHLLPQGFMLTKVHVPRFSHQLRGSTTDRKDFYSQCMVTRERAFSNAVKPSFVLRDFAGTRAYDEYVAWAQHDAGLLCNRRFCPGPREAPGASLRASLLHPGAPVHGCFASLFQGDAAGVELATAAHSSFLESCGILPSAEHGRLLARHPVSASGPWSGVVIDDLFCVSCQPRGSCDPESSDSARLIARAKDAYLREGIRGSDDKDVFGADVFTIAGAECDSSPAAVKEGNVSVGAPLHKRLTLAAVTLQATASRHISLELSSMLAGVGFRADVPQVCHGRRRKTL